MEETCAVCHGVIAVDLNHHLEHSPLCMESRSYRELLKKHETTLLQNVHYRAALQFAADARCAFDVSEGECLANPNKMFKCGRCRAKAALTDNP